MVESELEHEWRRTVTKLGFQVRQRIEYLNDGLVDRNGARHQHQLTQGVCQALREKGFASAGRAVDEDCATRVQGRAELIQQLVADYDPLECIPHALARDPALMNALLAHYA